MSTYDERFMQADRHARIKADAAYDLGRNNEEKASLYYSVYSTEMNAFKQLEAMRKPLPNQVDVDALAARILTEQNPWNAAFRDALCPRCPECDMPTPTGRCAHCQGD